MTLQPPGQSGSQPPAQGTPAPQIPPYSDCLKTPEKKKQPPLGVRILLRITAVLLSILLFVTLLAGIVIYDGQQLLSRDTLEELLDDLDEDDYEDSEILQMLQNEMVYWVGAILETEYGERIEVDRDDIVSFLEESTINEFLAEKATGYVRDILEGTRNTHVTTRELRKLYNENKETLEDELHIRISDQMDREIRKNLEQIDVDAMVQANVFDYLESDEGPTREARELLELISAVFSTDTLIIFCVIIVILIVALVLCNRLHPVGSLVHSGVPMIFAGLLIMLPLMLAGPVFMEIFRQSGGNMPTEVANTLTLLLSRCTSMLTTAPLVVLIAGGVFVIAGVVLKLIFKKK